MTVELAARIIKVTGLAPEHVTTHVLGDTETDAVLVDAWGRTHPLGEHTVVGRELGCGLAVLQTSVSRRHAELHYDSRADAWTVTDKGSRNGTLVEGKRLAPEQAHPLGDRQLVQFGDVAFIHVLDAETLPTASASKSYLATQQSLGPGMVLSLSAPTADGAGVARYDGSTVAIGPTQYALLRLLATRARASAAESPEIRGFVRSIELITDIPWNTPHPEDNHVKQQVRRLRRALERLGLADAIESRHGFGYRLVVPTSDD